MKYLTALVIILMGVFLNVISVQAHIEGEPFFTINGEFTKAYPVEAALGDKIFIPQDIASKEYLINQDLNFEVDTNLLPFTKEAISQLKLSWDFGDGTLGEGFENTHSYKKAGAYFLVIKSDTEKLKPQVFQSVLINIVPFDGYLKPEIQLKINNSPAVADQKIHFSENYGFFKLAKLYKLGYELKNSPSAQIKSVQWVLEEGVYKEGNEASVRFNKDYYFGFIVLRVIDNNGILTDQVIRVENLDKNEAAPLQMIVFIILASLIIFIGWVYLKSRRRQNFGAK
jgi:hypothetical protein